jgi:hypothetical protein
MTILTGGHHLAECLMSIWFTWHHYLVLPKDFQGLVRSVMWQKPKNRSSDEERSQSTIGSSRRLEIQLGQNQLNHHKVTKTQLAVKVIPQIQQNSLLHQKWI